MLITLFGQIKIIADGHEIDYEAIPYDSPRRKETATKPGCDFCSAMSIIRSVDGPTAIMVGVPQEAKVYSACSGLYFEKQEFVEWRMSFRVKTVDDVEIRLI